MRAASTAADTRLVLGLLFSLGACAHGPGQRGTTPVERLRADAARLRPLVETPLAQRFLDATAALEHVAPRKLFRSPDHERAYTAAAVERLAPAERAALEALPVDEEYYFNTRYGSPLAYVRALELLGQAGVSPAAETRVLDFGFGGIRPLRLLGSLRVDLVGGGRD